MNHDITTLFSIQNLVAFMLIMSRISGMLATAPLFSTFPIPMQVKAGLCALTAFIMAPYVIQNSTFLIPHDLITMTLIVFKEVFIGVLIGFCAGLIFVGIQIGGQILSMQMGLAIASALDPVTKQSVPIVGQFYLFMASMLFLYLNGHHWLFTSILDSYQAVPIGLSFEFSTDLVEKTLYFTSQIFTIAFAIVMPVFGILFVTDIALAFVSKMMPQMNIFIVGLPLKIYIGLLFMSIMLPATAVYLSGLIGNTLDNIKSIFM